MAARKRKAHASRPARQQADAGTRRARLWLLGAVVLAAVIMFAWFPASSLLSQRSNLAGTAAGLASLHTQDRALAQEKKSLSDTGEIGRIAREQYQLVSPGQQAYEVLPPSGAAATGTPYSGDPGSRGPVTPAASAELPPGGATTTTTVAPSAARSHGPQQSQAPAAAPGLLSRMLHALEFWG
ncbi:MAG TPA: septum formation initiator family protein [Acidimicrobiales bacterium]|nr:septum formation initiator family protein [Acidimicrobiales bacterium]